MARPTAGQAWPRYVADGGGDGGGGLLYPLSAPSVPNALDDEFTTNPIDPAWSVQDGMVASLATITPNATIDTTESWLRGDMVASAGADTTRTYRIMKALTGLSAGTAFSVYARVTLSNWTSTTAWVQMALNSGSAWGAGVSTEMLYMSLERVSGAYRFGVYDNSTTLATQTIPEGIQTIYWALRRNASNVVDVYLSYDGIGWRQVLNNSSRPWNVTRLFINFIGPASGVEIGRNAVDFVRFNDARLMAPVRP